MAFNNYFPAYNPYMPTLPQMPQQQPQAQSNGIIWVQGEAGAKAHPVGAGQSALLMDSENNVFYIKSTDISGMPQKLRVFDYTERREDVSVKPQETSQAVFDTSLFVTYDELEKRLAALTDEKKAISRKDSDK